ncbi:MAG: NUDIX hydrolase [Chloroflexi bacterium]|nr:NUDIX hydrolase [Chloroflexota bacterium]
MKERGEERTLESRRIYQGQVVSLRVDTVSLPGGRVIRREIVEHRSAVAIVPLDGAGNILMVRQFRRAAGVILLEVPAGLVEEGETIEDGAHRELAEETGYRAGRLEKLAGFYSAPGFCTEFLNVFLATELTPGTPHTEADEDIEAVWMPLPRIRELIASGEVRDAKSVAGLMLALDRLEHPLLWPSMSAK